MNPNETFPLACQVHELGGREPEFDLTQAVVDGAARRVAYPLSVPAGGVTVVVDGIGQGVFDGLGEGTLGFSPDGSRVTFAAVRGDAQFAVVDGDAGIGWPRIEAGGVVFSADGDRYAYMASDDAGTRVVCDGLPGPVYEGLTRGGISFSPDGTQLAYGIARGDARRVTVNGQEGPAFERLGEIPPTFSPDGRHLAYIGVLADGHHMVLDEQAGPAFEDVGVPIFGPTAGRLAYVVVMGEHQAVVLDGERGPWFDEVPQDTLRFSADGSSFAYAGVRWIDGKPHWIVVHDGVEGPAWEGFRDGDPTFSAAGSLLYKASGQGLHHIVIDGVVGPGYEGIVKPSYVVSADGQHITYVSGRGDERFLVADGVIVATLPYVMLDPAIAFDDVGQVTAISFDDGRWTVLQNGMSSPVYDDFGHVPGARSPDLRQLAYVAGRKELAGGETTFFVVHDGVEGRGYPAIGHGPVFGPDGRHLAYVAGRPGAWQIVVDGVAAPEGFTDLLGCSRLVFDGPTSLYLVAMRNGGLVRLDIGIGA